MRVLGNRCLDLVVRLVLQMIRGPCITICVLHIDVVKLGASSPVPDRACDYLLVLIDPQEQRARAERRK